MIHLLYVWVGQEAKAAVLFKAMTFLAYEIQYNEP